MYFKDYVKNVILNHNLNLPHTVRNICQFLLINRSVHRTVYIMTKLYFCLQRTILEIVRLAQFLQVEYSPSDIVNIMEKCSFHNLYMAEVEIKEGFKAKTRFGTPLMFRKGDLVFDQSSLKQTKSLATVNAKRFTCIQRVSNLVYDKIR